MAARACVAGLALVMLAWLSVMALDDRALRRGVELSGRLRSAADAARAEAALRDARRMNPDSAPDVARAVLYEGPRRARALRRSARATCCAASRRTSPPGRCCTG